MNPLLQPSLTDVRGAVAEPTLRSPNHGNADGGNGNMPVECDSGERPSRRQSLTVTTPLLQPMATLLAFTPPTVGLSGVAGANRVSTPLEPDDAADVLSGVIITQGQPRSLTLLSNPAKQSLGSGDLVSGMAPAPIVESSSALSPSPSPSSSTPSEEKRFQQNRLWLTYLDSALEDNFVTYRYQKARRWLAPVICILYDVNYAQFYLTEENDFRFSPFERIAFYVIFGMLPILALVILFWSYGLPTLLHWCHRGGRDVTSSSSVKRNIHSSGDAVDDDNNGTQRPTNGSDRLSESRTSRLVDSDRTEGADGGFFNAGWCRWVEKCAPPAAVEYHVVITVTIVTICQSLVAWTIQDLLCRPWSGIVARRGFPSNAASSISKTDPANGTPHQDPCDHATATLTYTLTYFALSPRWWTILPSVVLNEIIILLVRLFAHARPWNSIYFDFDWERLAMTAVGLIMLRQLEMNQRLRFNQLLVQQEEAQAAEETHGQVNRMLSCMVPREVMERMLEATGLVASSSSPQTADVRWKPSSIVDSRHATIVWSDVAGFTAWSARRSVIDVLEMLNIMYRSFDRALTLPGFIKICRQQLKASGVSLSSEDPVLEAAVDKIGTVGDAYVACCGLIRPDALHPLKMMYFASAMQDAVSSWRRQRPTLFGEVGIRVGVNTGVLCGGVVGSRAMTYQVFGSTAEKAQQLEAAAPVGGVLVSDRTLEAIRRGRPVVRTVPASMASSPQSAALMSAVNSKEGPSPLRGVSPVAFSQTKESSPAAPATVAVLGGISRAPSQRDVSSPVASHMSAIFDTLFEIAEVMVEHGASVVRPRCDDVDLLADLPVTVGISSGHVSPAVMDFNDDDVDAMIPQYLGLEALRGRVLSHVLQDPALDITSVRMQATHHHHHNIVHPPALTSNTTNMEDASVRNKPLIMHGAGGAQVAIDVVSNPIPAMNGKSLSRATSGADLHSVTDGSSHGVSSLLDYEALKQKIFHQPFRFSLAFGDPQIEQRYETFADYEFCLHFSWAAAVVGGTAAGCLSIQFTELNFAPWNIAPYCIILTIMTIALVVMYRTVTVVWQRDKFSYYHYIAELQHSSMMIRRRVPSVGSPGGDTAAAAVIMTETMMTMTTSSHPEAFPLVSFPRIVRRLSRFLFSMIILMLILFWIAVNFMDPSMITSEASHLSVALAIVIWFVNSPAMPFFMKLFFYCFVSCLPVFFYFTARYGPEHAFFPYMFLEMIILIPIGLMAGLRQSETIRRSEFVVAEIGVIAAAEVNQEKRNVTMLLQRVVPAFILPTMMRWLGTDRRDVIAFRYPTAGILFIGTNLNHRSDGSVAASSSTRPIGLRSVMSDPELDQRQVASSISDQSSYFESTSDWYSALMDPPPKRWVAADETLTLITDIVRVYDEVLDSLPSGPLVCNNSIFGSRMPPQGSITTALVTKIKTIGDVILLASGIHADEHSAAVNGEFDTALSRASWTSPTVHLQALAVAACTIVEALQSRLQLEAFAGLHCGPVIAGVVGNEGLAFDVFGDTVNTASRIMTAQQKNVRPVDPSVKSRVWCSDIFAALADTSLHMDSAGMSLRSEGTNGWNQSAHDGGRHAHDGGLAFGVHGVWDVKGIGQQPVRSITMDAYHTIM